MFLNLPQKLSLLNSPLLAQQMKLPPLGCQSIAGLVEPHLHNFELILTAVSNLLRFEIEAAFELLIFDVDHFPLLLLELYLLNQPLLLVMPCCRLGCLLLQAYLQLDS